jgi:hypothetical protein
VAPRGTEKSQMTFRESATRRHYPVKGADMLISKIGAGVAISAALILIAGNAQAQGTWTIVTAPPTGQNGVLEGVTSTSDTNAWAVGYSNAAANGLGAEPVIDQWNGTAWSQVTAPPTGYSTNVLADTSASSTSDAWAVGWSEPERYTFHPLAMHWNGTAWSDTTSFTAALEGQIADGVADISSTDAYAIGGGLGSADEGEVAQWNGTTWTRLTVPLPQNDNLASNLTGISADSADDVWIVGTYELEVTSSDYADETYSLHWNGSSWSIISMPLEPGTNPNFEYVFDSVHAISPTNVWAVGQAVNVAEPSSATTLIEHWNGTAWSIVASPSVGTGDNLTGVTASSATDVWAVGYDTPSGSSTAQTLTLNWNGTAWSTVASPNASTGSSLLTSVATAPGAAIIQAVGYSGTSGAFNPLAMQNG